MNTRRQMKWGIGVFLIVMLILFLFVPSLIAYVQNDSAIQEDVPVSTSEKQYTAQSENPVEFVQDKSTNIQTGKEQVIAVYRSNQEKVEKVELDQYLFGVLAGEMPASFELEALKAQAVAARTYIAKMIYHREESNLPEGADVTDTVTHQVYHSEEELKEMWGEEYASKADKIKKAIAETDDLVLTYENEPIRALFFSTSNGYTENSEEYWKNALPYLKSVPSPWDVDTPKYKKEKVISLLELKEKLGVTVRVNHELMEETIWTTGKAIAKTKIGGKTFTGREVREKLELASSDFTMKWKDESILVTTKGYGHQVGMSQYGANGMAKEGKTFKEILLHYYTDVNLENGLSFFVDGKL